MAKPKMTPDERKEHKRRYDARRAEYERRLAELRERDASLIAALGAAEQAVRDADAVARDERQQHLAALDGLDRAHKERRRELVKAADLVRAACPTDHQRYTEVDGEMPDMAGIFAAADWSPPAGWEPPPAPAPRRRAGK